MTRSRVSGRRLSSTRPFRTRETVDGCTLAARATSMIVMRGAVTAPSFVPLLLLWREARVVTRGPADLAARDRVDGRDRVDLVAGHGAVVLGQHDEVGVHAELA